MLKVAERHYKALRAHGEETSPHECCGILLGPLSEGESQVVDLMRAGNTRTDSAHNRYHIAPQELIKAQREGRKQGLAVAQGKAAVTNSFLLRGTGEEDKQFADQEIVVTA